MVARPSQRYIKLGMTASLTGRYSHPGSQALVGAQAWVEDDNRGGGIRLNEADGPLQVRLVHYDDESNPRLCAELTERLIVQDQVDVLLGPYSSGLSLSAASVARRRERVLWNHGGASEAIFQLGSDWVVGILTPASMYFHGIIDMVRLADPAARRVAIAHSRAGAFPREVASGAQRRCADRGFDIIRTYGYDARTTDFGRVLEGIERDRPDLVLGVGRIEDDIRFAQQFVDSGIAVPAVGLVAATLALFERTLGRAAERFLGPSQWEPDVIAVPDYGPSSQEVLERLTARRASEVDYPMAQAYAGCLVARRCIEEAGSLDNRALRHAAGSLDFTTFYGRFLIEPDTGRQLGHAMPVVRWERGDKVVVWPPEMRRGSVT